MASIHENISLLDTLGKGRYGVVRLARNIVGVPLPPHSQKTGEMYAVKVIHRGTVSENILQQELSVLRVLKDEVHDSNLVRIVDIYEDSCLVHVVMEYMGGGDLYHRLLTKKCFSEREAANVIARIGSALRALHRKHIYHLDVKPENIIYESNDNHAPMKLADFGCSLQAESLSRDVK